jgi:hypothetical protein
MATNPFGGSLSVVWMPLGSQNPSQPDLNLQKTSKVSLLKMLHTTKKVKKNFCLLGENIFLKKTL